MKIVFVITRSDVMGGASVHLLDLAVGLQSKGYNCHIFVGGAGVLQEQAEARGVSVTSLKYLVREINLFKDIMAIIELKRNLQYHKPDIIHLHSSKAGLIGRVVSKLLNIPCVFTAHGWAFTEGVSSGRRLIYSFLERLVSPLADKIIAVSDYDRNLALKHNITSYSHIVTIHNGVADKSRFINHARNANANANVDEVRFIMVARFEQPKNQVRVIKAFLELVELPWHLEFVGDGPNLKAATELCSQLGLNHKITFSGACSDVPKRLATSDVFILLSYWEGLPLTILEAMSLRLPIVASNVGGIKETIDSSCGFLVDSDQDQTLLDILRKLIFSPNLRNDLGKSARSRYEKLFTLERMISDTEMIYREIVNKR